MKETNYYQEKDVVVPTYVDKIVHGRVDLEALKRHAADNTIPEDIDNDDIATRAGAHKVASPEK